MTKIDIYSGFLGAGKTTLIKKLISDCYKGEKLVLIENEFGEIGIDGGFLQDSGIEISEMNSGCICCSLVGDFRTALAKVIDEFAPDRILIEPSGVGKLSDVIKAVESVADEKVVLNAFTTVVDAGKCKMYMKNFGEFFNDQIEHAGTIIMSHADSVKEEKLKTAVELVREKNPSAVIVTTPINDLEPEVLVSAIERKDTLNAVLDAMHKEHGHHHEHHHHEHDEDCDCGCHEHHHEHHHHEHDEDCDCGCHDHHHEHHHHEHDEDCDCGCHEHHHEHHHHEHDEDCDCGCHEHHHEHHHHEHDEDCDCGCHDH
ncbi:MAG: cobalamin biosynthesis protein CobW, partial [Ruminococcaceae bacterium]|nr:cobalamin biosynthesis protein CobW [Oscillospiraceae bacterium]